MDFRQLLTAIMEFLYINLVLPINDLLFMHGYEVTGLDMQSISLGFGDVTWFTINLVNLSLLIIGFAVSITALVLTWKFVKMLSNFVRRLFGGVRK